MVRTRLISVQQRTVSLKRQKFISLTATLDAISPLKVLTRGYAIVTASNGKVVRSAKQLQPIDQISIRLNDGQVDATINSITEDIL